MSNRFRDLLRKVGSGHHTSESLTRTESADAARMILTQEATPAQIGAFMIAHRIKRPTGEELAGMLDAYAELGPRLAPIQADYPVIVMNSPYDGRSRTAPVSPITALVLVTKGCPVLFHGGDRMPTKYGIPLIDIWKALGIDWTLFSLSDTQQIFEKTRLGFLYMPNHFPLAQGLVPYRDQLGKRPPQATLELMWCPYGGDALMVCGFVHPPTEMMILDAVMQHRPMPFLTVKGLEGSVDLSRDRTCIIGQGNRLPPDVRLTPSPVGSAPITSGLNDAPEPFQNNGLSHLFLHPRDYGFAGKDVALVSDAAFFSDMMDVIHGNATELMKSAIWNSGFYLWQSGVCSSFELGLSEAETLLTTGAVHKTLQAIQATVSNCQHPKADALIGAG